MLAILRRYRAGRREIVVIAAALGGAAMLRAGADGAASMTGAPGGIRYVDVAPRSNFAYRTNNDFTGRKYFPQPLCGGVAVLDFDNDGRLDIFFSNGAKLPELKKTNASFYHCLLRGLGGGLFEDVTARAGLLGADLDFSFGVAAGDYDNDGWADLFLCQAGRNALYHNQGDGTFRDVTVRAGLDDKAKDLLSVCAAWFDYDNDGRLDLVVDHYTYWSPAADILCLMGDRDEFYCSPRKYKAVPHSLYRNQGDGVFANVTQQSGFAKALGKGMGIGIADFDGDGRVDVFVSNDTEPHFLYMNQGGGALREEGWMRGVAYNDEGETVSGMGADAKDFDNDGAVDIFYNDLHGQIWGLFRNLGKGEFASVGQTTGIAALSRRFSGWSCGFIDFDNDGWKDIYSANGYVDYMGDNAAQHDTMFRNIEGKRFDDVSERLGEDFLRLGFQRGSVFADFNNDGFLDIVITSLAQAPRILMSAGGNGNHWLLVEAIGRRSNRDSVGAKVRVTTASGRVLHNHVTTSVGFMGSSDRRVHFGLGGESELLSVEIHWPSGKSLTLKDVVADQILRVEEPS